MNGTALTTAPSTTAAADVLLRAADALATGTLPWGRDQFVCPDGARCVLGAIAWAADQTDSDGDPRWVRLDVRPAAVDAMDLLARYLIDERDAPAAGSMEVDPATWTNVFVMDPIETVGDWNDQPDRRLADVVTALRAAAQVTR